MTYVAGDDMSVSAILIYKTADFIYLINTLKLAKVPAILIMHGGVILAVVFDRHPAGRTKHRNQNKAKKKEKKKARQQWKRR